MTDNKDKNNMVSAQPPVLTEEQLQQARGARGYVPTEAPVENKPASAAVNADVAQPKYGSFGDIIGALEQDAARYKAETDAQKKAREKREKWQGVIGGLRIWAVRWRTCFLRLAVRRICTIMRRG